MRARERGVQHEGAAAGVQVHERGAGKRVDANAPTLYT